LTTNPRAEVTEFIRSLLSRREENPVISDSESLIDSGRIGSLLIVEILIFLEDHYRIDFASRPFDPLDLDSVDKIVEVIRASGTCV
jgi:acyl carrier protein